MKHKILLTGKNDAVKEEFFHMLDFNMECQTTTCRYEDVACHIKYYAPDVLVYCMQAESREEMMNDLSTFRRTRRNKMKLVVIGEQEDTDEYMYMSDNLADLLLDGSIKEHETREKFLNFLDETARMRQLEEEYLAQQSQESEETKQQAKPHTQVQKTQKQQGQKQQGQKQQGQKQRGQSQPKQAQSQEKQQSQAQKLQKPQAKSQSQAQKSQNQQGQKAQSQQQKQQELLQQRLAKMKQNLKTTKAPDIKSKAEETRQDDVAQSTEQQNRRTEQQMNGISQQPDTIKHILVIDDDATMLRLIKEQLKEEYNIATAISGKIGLKFLERKQTDLILLDYEMPEMNGADVLETLRNNPQTKDIPVLFLTGTKERKKIQRALSLKPQGYLLKPIKAEQLSREIKKVIG